MPGVADAERLTRLKQDKKGRTSDKNELLRLVKEGRLHEADERQLETIKLALELNQLLSPPQGGTSNLDPEVLAGALKSAMSEVLSQLPAVTERAINPETSVDASRPRMKHVDLTVIQHTDTGLEIKQDDTLVHNQESEEDSANKLRRLKELRGPK